MTSKNSTVMFSDNVLDLPEQIVNRASPRSPRANPRPSECDKVADSQKCLTALRPHLQMNSVRLPSQPALLAITFIAKHNLKRRRRIEAGRIPEDQARERQLRELGEKLQVLTIITLGLVISQSYRNHFADTSPSDASPHQRPFRIHVDLKVEICGVEMDVGLVLLLLLVIRRQVMEASRNNYSKAKSNGSIVEAHHTTTYTNITYIEGNGNNVTEIGSTENITGSAKVTVKVPLE